jgi:hypothetical protein
MNRRRLWMICGLALSALITERASAQYPVLIAGILGTEPYGCTALLVPPADWYLLDDPGGFASGDTVVVYAQRLDFGSCGTHQSYWHFSQATVFAWRDFDFGCGVLSSDSEYGCEWFHSSRYGVLTTGGLAQYETGDSIRIFGTLWFPACGPIPECGGGGCITATRVEPCDTSTAVTPRTWGSIKAKFRERH